MWTAQDNERYFQQTQGNRLKNSFQQIGQGKMNGIMFSCQKPELRFDNHFNQSYNACET